MGPKQAESHISARSSLRHCETRKLQGLFVAATPSFREGVHDSPVGWRQVRRQLCSLLKDALLCGLELPKDSQARQDISEWRRILSIELGDWLQKRERALNALPSVVETLLCYMIAGFSASHS